MRGKAAKSIWNCIKICAAGVVSIGLLSALCLVYMNTGIHIENETGATDYRWESNQYKASMTEGFSWMRMDEGGFNNAYPAQDVIDILLMGSSHMEALNVPRDKNTGYLLNVYLPSLYTYNIGTSGHTIYNCANNLKAAVETYHPTSYVIIETDRLDLDCSLMEEVMGGALCAYSVIRLWNNVLPSKVYPISEEYL